MEKKNLGKADVGIMAPITIIAAQVLVSISALLYRFLLVSLCPIVRLAEHLTVANVRCAALRPCRYMVGLHLLEVVKALRVGGGTDGAKRTV